MMYDDDLLPLVEDYFDSGAAQQDMEAIGMNEIVKEAEFNSYESDFRVVRLSASYSQWGLDELFVALDHSYSCNLMRTTGSGKTRQFALSIREMDTLCEAWEQYKADYEAFKAAQEAKQQTERY